MITREFKGTIYIDENGLKWLFVRPAVYKGNPAYYYRQVPATTLYPGEAGFVPQVAEQKKSVWEGQQGSNYEYGNTAPITPVTQITTQQPVMTIPTSDAVTVSDTPPFPVETIIETITSKDKVLGLAVMAGIGLTFAYWVKHQRR